MGSIILTILVSDFFKMCLISQGIFGTVIYLLYSHSFCNEKVALERWPLYIEDDNLKVFYYPSATWSDKKGDLIRGRLLYTIFMFIPNANTHQFS